MPGDVYRLPWALKAVFGVLWRFNCIVDQNFKHVGWKLFYIVEDHEDYKNVHADTERRGYTKNCPMPTLNLAREMYFQNKMLSQ